MQQYGFACLSQETAEQIFEDIEELLDAIAQTCEQFDEPEKSILLSALQTNGLNLLRPISQGVIFDLIEWAKVFALIEKRSGQELDSKAIGRIIVPFVVHISNLNERANRVYADDGQNVVSFVNTRISRVTSTLRRMIALARQFKEERA